MRGVFRTDGTLGKSRLVRGTLCAAKGSTETIVSIATGMFIAKSLAKIILHWGTVHHGHSASRRRVQRSFAVQFLIELPFESFAISLRKELTSSARISILLKDRTSQ